MKINSNSIIKRLFIKAKNKILKTVRNNFNQTFLIKKEKLLAEIKNHVVSQELEGGELGPALSGATNGYGNLFAFIGFPAGSNPVEHLITFLDKNIKVEYPTTLTPTGRASIKIFIPSERDFARFMPLPWENGRSWPHAIEQGIGNLGFFLSRVGSGRSGSGIQTAKPIRNQSFRPVPYISDLLENFKKSF